mgnify:CR=1 FL=1
MTSEERKAQALKAAEAKRELALLPRATHTGKLRLIDQEIPCAVLEDGTRVLTQSDFMEAMGMYYSGWIAKNAPIDGDAAVPAEVPHFLAQKTLIPFINKHLGHLQNIVLKYRTEKGAAVQTAAMALRLLVSLNAYEYRRAAQHQQPALAVVLHPASPVA